MKRLRLQLQFITILAAASSISVTLAQADSLAQNACASLQPGKTYDYSGIVSQVYDGDTLRLGNGRKVRLIGINTPETGRKNKTDEPFAKEAKKALKALVKNNKTINLLYGKEKQDNYGRFLAHGFLADGQNIQATLLRLGLARAIAIPPNVKFSACYQQQELAARCNMAGLWKKNRILQAKDLRKNLNGFQLIQGTVKQINNDKQGTWLNIDNKLTIGIRPDNQHLFDKKILNNMLNQSIIVRGWLNKSNKSTPYYLRVRHPSSLQLASTFACG